MAFKITQSGATAAVGGERDIAGNRVVIDPPDDLFKPVAVPGEAPPKKRTRSPRARDRFEAASDPKPDSGEV